MTTIQNYNKYIRVKSKIKDYNNCIVLFLALSNIKKPGSTISPITIYMVHSFTCDEDEVKDFISTFLTKVPHESNHSNVH